MKKSHRSKRRTGLKVWIAIIALVAALLVIGKDDPELRRMLQDRLEEVITARSPAKRHVGGTRIIDGDTLDVAGTRVRLYGIDAPEKAQICRRSRRDWPCGRDAMQALEGEVDGRPVSCEEQDIDRYGRVVGICRAGTSDLNAWMVRNGWAVAYRQYGGDRYDPEELTAKRARRGIWDSSFEMPWDWRKGLR